jgi:predicted branched-subunit amino acid permease
METTKKTSIVMAALSVIVIVGITISNEWIILAAAIAMIFVAGINYFKANKK